MGKGIVFKKGNFVTYKREMREKEIFEVNGLKKETINALGKIREISSLLLVNKKGAINKNKQEFYRLATREEVIKQKFTKIFIK